jgi:phage terminase large subunit-like protein
LGIAFRPWQHGAGQVILAKRDDGKYAATIGGTGMSIPRQVGKTFLVGAIVFALCLLRPNLTVIWTAHRLRTAEETFGKMQAFAKRKRIAPHVSKIVLGSGEEEVRFRNGSRILFGARERGFGRGFDEVDVLIFDEGQILTENALDDMIPATNQSREASGALLLFMGTPPKPTDPGDVFRRMRTEALSGEDDDTGWIEFGCDADYAPTELPAPLTDADWEQIAKANPSFPEDTPREAILRMRKKLGPDSFLREGLGIWDEIDVSMSVIPLDLWGHLEAQNPPAQDAPPTALAVDRWHDGTTAVAAAWRDGERVHVELVAVDVTADSSAVVDWIVERAGRRLSVMIAGDSPAAALVPDLRARRVKVNTASVADLGKACVGFLDDVLEGRLSHADQRQLNDAIVGAKKREIGSAGVWGWDRKSPEQDISPLVAATLARYAAAINNRPKTSSGGGRRVVTV